MRADYANRRPVATSDGLTRLHLRIRRCHHVGCTPHKKPYRPEAEGRLALPHHEFGRDVIALVGRLRYAEHRSVPEIRARLVGRGVAVAARPTFEADRNAKKVLKKRVRQVRPIDRSVEGRSDPSAEVVRGYCGAVRRALTDDGRPPLAASGLKLHDRLTAISGSIGRAGAKGGSRPS